MMYKVFVSLFSIWLKYLEENTFVLIAIVRRKEVLYLLDNIGMRQLLQKIYFGDQKLFLVFIELTVIDRLPDKNFLRQFISNFEACAERSGAHYRQHLVIEKFCHLEIEISF